MTKNLSLVKRHLKLAYETAPDDDKHTSELKEVIRLTIDFVEAMEPPACEETTSVVFIADYIARQVR